MVPKPVRNVSVVHEDELYHVVLTNNLNQTVRPFSHRHVREVLTVAADYSDFHGVPLLPFRIGGQVITPVRSELYSDARDRDFKEYHDIYRMADRSLNWNKIMHYEWNRIRRKFKDKTAFKKWILPYGIDIELTAEGKKRAKAWLTANCIGSWMHASGGYRFQNDRDATLFKLYHHAPINAVES